MIYQQRISHCWKEENLSPFDELILSWNASRPISANFLFYISVKLETWSPPFLFASWGSSGQSSFVSTIQDLPIRIYQDTLQITDNTKATGFRIEVETQGEGSLCDIRMLYVYTNSKKIEIDHQSEFKSVYLQVDGLSQMKINHPRAKDLCSPASTTAVIRYLLQNNSIDPIEIATKVWDRGFDIFGNWVFATAAASSYLGNNWNCWVERLEGFEHLYQYLCKKTPVIVSIRGPLEGGALPYIHGHLVVVIGYDAKEKKVLCMDPAFPNERQTHVFYNLQNFVDAWKRRGMIAYLFSQNVSSNHNAPT